MLHAQENCLSIPVWLIAWQHLKQYETRPQLFSFSCYTWLLLWHATDIFPWFLSVIHLLKHHKAKWKRSFKHSKSMRWLPALRDHEAKWFFKLVFNSAKRERGTKRCTELYAGTEGTFSVVLNVSQSSVWVRARYMKYKCKFAAANDLARLSDLS